MGLEKDEGPIDDLGGDMAGLEENNPRDPLQEM
jgi:hypothetical protein